ncbi:arylamine N-acetyltransferase [uncultured Pseudodesulfovibrio sp.]|uniref:arylamine N-acetyltransferase family protein n=1 Tax=uncultured Pseudodesulfovibrio sp. TaxID=2035858 RepID=UPI0029C944CB|nr:arylamine N-acetyltransferase [uncultured Pseudodesulfovibrio sp.]
MSPFEFDSIAYLQRLHLPEDVSPTTEGLRSLQRAQLYNIPFENFDIQLGRGVDLDPANLFDKLVRRPRGGYCFELNGLFLLALRAFGFDARPLLSRVHVSGQPSGRGHQLSLVNVEGRQWLADVGFGKDNPAGPYLLERDTVQDIRGKSFRLVDGGVFGNMLQVRTDDGWQDLYSLDMEHVCQGDINYGVHYTSTSSKTLFTKARVAMKHMEDGMITLCNSRLTLSRAGEKTEVHLPEGQGYLDALNTYFGIELDAPYEALRPVE